MLSTRQKKQLKALAHAKKPVVIIGSKGLSQAVVDELETAISHHELIKVRINADDRESRALIIETIGARLQADIVQKIGHTAVFYRKNEEKK